MGHFLVALEAIQILFTESSPVGTHYLIIRRLIFSAVLVSVRI